MEGEGLLLCNLNHRRKLLAVRVLSFRSNNVFLECLHSFQSFPPSPSLHCFFCYEDMKKRLLSYLRLNHWVNVLAGEPGSLSNHRYVTLNGTCVIRDFPYSFETSQELFETLLMQFISLLLFRIQVVFINNTIRPEDSTL